MVHIVTVSVLLPQKLANFEAIDHLWCKVSLFMTIQCCAVKLMLLITIPCALPLFFEILYHAMPRWFLEFIFGSRTVKAMRRCLLVQLLSLLMDLLRMVALSLLILVLNEAFYLLLEHQE